MQISASSKVHSTYLKWQPLLVCAGVFLIPIKLSLAYIVLLPLLICWLVFECSKQCLCERPLSLLIAPLFALAITFLFSSIFGLYPLHSSLRSLWFATTILIIPFIASAADKVGPINLFLYLALGQTLAALHSVLESSFPQYIPALFLGRVTESGQLGVTLLLVLGIVLYSGSSKTDSISAPSTFRAGPYAAQIICAGFTFILLVASAFHTRLGLSATSLIAALLCATALLSSSAYRYFCNLSQLVQNHTQLSKFLLCFILPLLSAALLINLKRGPWSGVALGAFILLAMYCRRYVLSLLVLIILSAVLFEPVRDRLLHSADHFFISGGRAEIWEIGRDLSQRNVLGIGYENSQILRAFSDEIPRQLRHFHNNFLNITVEAGWVSLAIFVWWLSCIFKLSFQNSLHGKYGILRAACGVAVISWQIAGLVEYNFGDSEVLLLVYVVLGCLSELARRELNPAYAASDSHLPASVSGSD